MVPGEIKIEGLGKRYWFRSLGESLEDREIEEEIDADPDADDEEGPISFWRPMSEVWALRDVSLHIKPGDRVGIIGPNGSGKSTLIRLLSRSLPPSEGIIEGAGIVISFGALIGPLSQDASGCENLMMLARLLGIPQAHLEERLPEIVSFSELGALAHEKVSRYSARSFTRLSSAMALFVDAAIYLIDDDLKVGDEAYRLKFHNKFAEVLQRKLTLCYASNKLHSVREYCGRAILLDHGRIIADGEVNSVISRFHGVSDEAIDLDEIESVPNDRGSAAEDSSTRISVRSITPEGSREPLRSWEQQVERAENAWGRVLRRWREKNRVGDPLNRGGASIRGESTRGTVYSLRCLNADGTTIARCLPGESIFVEFLAETFENNVKIEARLELHRLHKLSMFVLSAEPLVPLTAAIAGQYLFRVEIPGDLMACYNKRVHLKFIVRTSFGAPGSDQRDIVIAKLRFEVCGDVRFQFEEQRFFGGEPATSIIEPAPVFVKAPAEIKGFEEPIDRAPPTEWELLNRDSALRPRLTWTIYRVMQSETERHEELLHENA